MFLGKPWKWFKIRPTETTIKGQSLKIVPSLNHSFGFTMYFFFILQFFTLHSFAADHMELKKAQISSCGHLSKTLNDE